MVVFMPGRSLSDEENERVIAAVRSLLADGTTQVALAERLAVDQATVSSFLAKRHRAGWAFARKVAAQLGIPVEDMLAGRSAKRASVWRDLPGATSAFDEARRMFPGVSAEAWAWVEGLAGSPPPSVAPVFFWTLATAYVNAPRDTMGPTLAAREGSGVRQKGRK